MLLNTLSPWPAFSKEEIQAVSDVIASNRVNYWTGDECRQFEREFAAWCGTKYAVALANGTVALDAALKAVSVGPGDEVIATPRTFIASVSCVINAGATPVFADVDRDSGNISAETIAPLINSRTKAIICVHLGGWPCEMDSIMELADRHGVSVIEDCAQAHGARYKGRSVGSIGCIGAWSFCQDKIMTTGGEGGMVTTNERDLWSQMWSLKDHGKNWESVYKRLHPPGFRWVHDSFGSNWRMLEMQAAIGRIQLRRMPEWKHCRAAHAEALASICRRYPIARVPYVSSYMEHAYYRFYTYVELRHLRTDWTRNKIIQEINEQGVPCNQGTCSEVYLEKAFDATGGRPKNRLPVARELGETSLALMVHPTLTDGDLQKTCRVLELVLERACR